MWIFGYGSLVWKVDFPYIKKVIGYIKGYERKFWQASIDHRGVPEKPGRVVTLVPSSDPEAAVWGVAYEIIDSDTKTIDALNEREKRFDQKNILFYPVEDFTNDDDQGSKLNKCSDDAKSMDAFTLSTYIGSSSGPLFLGEASISDIAYQIAHAEGPSGKNADYVFNLAKFMRNHVPHYEDLHLFAIEKELYSFVKT